MTMEMIREVLTPFLGTSLGAACVFFVRGQLNRRLQRALTGFAAGVMTAASVWSLLIPAMEQAEHMGNWAFVPATAGLWAGLLFLMLLDQLVPHLHMNSEQAEGPRNRLKKSSMMILAVALHNLPEGMAVGVVLAGMAAGSEGVSAAAALTLSLGIAIQNFPEGAIISMPLRDGGMSRRKAFGYGVLSGVVEPVGAILTLLAAEMILPVLPCCLSFAAGAMLYVVVEELIPEMSAGEHTHIGTVLFSVGFTAMMALDIVMG